jgi:hypothetical protein
VPKQKTALTNATGRGDLLWQLNKILRAISANTFKLWPPATLTGSRRTVFVFFSPLDGPGDPKTPRALSDGTY